MKDQFLIKQGLHFLNFGSFGACPKPVFATYQEFQLELEHQPVEFLVEKAPQYLKNSRIALGDFLNADPDNLVCITNPSYGVNIVAKNLDLKSGDEILSTDLEYGACDRTWNYYCKKTGAKYVRNQVSLPISSKEEFLEEFKKGITPQTKLIFISHITSSTALIFPVKEICQIAKEHGIKTFVDGAHAPGQIEVDLQDLDADFYVGACHKWMLAPKGSSFLYAKKEHQSWLDPLIVSWGYEAAFPSHSQFLDYHEMQGTRDISAICTIPAAIRFMEENNWNETKKQCREMVHKNAPKLCSILGKIPLAPISDEFIGQMFSCEIETEDPKALHDQLLQKFNIEIPVMPHGNKAYIRYSINAFNSQEDLDQLFSALQEIYTK